MGNISGHNYVLNTMSVNRQGVLFAGGDNGMFRFCDWKTGYCFQEERTIVQPGMVFTLLYLFLLSIILRLATFSLVMDRFA